MSDRPPQLGAVRPLRSVSLVFPLIPASAKNRTQIRRPRGGGRPWVAKSKEAESDQAEIRLRAQHAIRHAVDAGETLFGRHYFGMEIVLDEDAARMRVTLHDLGPRARGKGWLRRDVHGVVESVADALQGVIFDDDRQARRVSVEWGRVEECA